MPRSRASSCLAGLTGLACSASLVLASPDACAYDWPQFNGNAQHSGNDSLETAISLSNVASLTRRFQVTLPGVVDGAPVVLTSVSTGSGARRAAGPVWLLAAALLGMGWRVHHGRGSRWRPTSA
jgi:hypothetical protein